MQEDIKSRTEQQLTNAQAHALTDSLLFDRSSCYHPWNASVHHSPIDAHASFHNTRSSPSRNASQTAELPPPGLVWMHNTLQLKGSAEPWVWSIEDARVLVSFAQFHMKGKGSSCAPRSQLQQAHTWAPGPRQCGRLSIRGEDCGRTKASVVQASHQG